MLYRLEVRGPWNHQNSSDWRPAISGASMTDVEASTFFTHKGAASLLTVYAFQAMHAWRAGRTTGLPEFRILDIPDDDDMTPDQRPTLPEVPCPNRLNHHRGMS
jgi:hypothetical protein